MNYKTPGVYIEEISIFPPSVAQVETAIPAFIGYTQSGPTTPKKIKSLVDYEAVYGGPAHELPEFSIDASGNISGTIPATPVYKLYYALQLYFANGGGPCYIVSVGNYTIPANVNDIDNTALTGGLALLKKEDEPTMIVFPDAPGETDLYVAAMQQCADLGDRFAICDVTPVADATDPAGSSATPFRNAIGTSNLMYGAAYYPNLETSLTHMAADDQIDVDNDGTAMKLRHTEEAITATPALADASLFHADNGSHKEKYYEIKKSIADATLEMPCSGAIAGVYAAVDSSRGVWKAPANVSLNLVKKPTVHLENVEQDGLNVSDTGKSINAIRFFTGKGPLVWGARTLDGNSNEWRYISVRRFFNMVEESVMKATERFVFEPNDANTWIKVKSMIENFLVLQWRAGALMGAKAEQAFFVKVGLGETMTEDDVLNGRMIVEIGMAVVRPAEFIILRFSHKMLES
ncbi:phage tail sheath family protein [Poritiphilus flavus]|uniref:Phage tail sheath family protein n=1 Tax=Poritiphilus flavus TaxID=2697053 RepID=A0A6L9EHR6_9FLAO|nr:phage tail sheath C-terminal domain-containing protein [Poritiphilus flavus]NAS14310.1 phage tail sheath family protein [Poritiphilus flavus]